MSFLLAALALGAMAAECGAQGLGDRSWQKRNDRGNRFEGEIDIPVSRPELELVSFVAYREDYYDDDVDLKVKFYLPRAADISLIARDMSGETQYGMLAKPERYDEMAWNVWEPWPTGDYLVPNGIPGWSLGVVVLLEGVESRELAPAFVFHSRPPATIQTYQLTVRPNTRLKSIAYAVFRGDQAVDRGEQDVDSYAGEPIRLDLDVADVSPGKLRVEIKGKFADRSGGSERQYSFFHEPLVSAEG